MALKDLIATPGEAAAARIVKQFRFTGTARDDLYAAVREAVDDALQQRAMERDWRKSLTK